MAHDYIFLHGGSQGGWVWKETIEALRRQDDGFGRAIALDIPGCGTKRGRDTSRLGIVDIVSEFTTELDRAGVRQGVLVGHSQAGTVLPSLIAARPSMFGKVVYVSCAAPAPGQSVMAMMGTSRHGENTDEVGWPLDPAKHALVEQFGLMFCNDMSQTETEAFLAKLGADAWPAGAGDATDWRYDQLGAIPATYVLCLADGILPPEWQLRFAARFGATRIVRVDAGHQVMNTRPHALAEILRKEADAS